MHIAPVGRKISALSSVCRPVVRLWNHLPIHCPYCCHPSDADSISAGERAAWCPHCQQVFEVPLLKAPSWIIGVLGILLINLQ